MMNQKEARKDAFQLCIDAFGDRLYEGKRAVWMIVFDSTERDRVCVMQRMPENTGRNLQDIETTARAVAAVGKCGDNAEMLSFLCPREEHRPRMTDDNGVLLSCRQDL